MKYYRYNFFTIDVASSKHFASLIRSLTDINFNEHYLISQRVLNVHVATFTVSHGSWIYHCEWLDNYEHIIPAANPRVEKPQWEKLSEIVNRV